MLPKRPCLAIICVLAGLRAATLLPAAAHAAALNFRTADFDILDAHSLGRIGAVHFEASAPAGGVQTVTSEAHYSSGEYDIERDTFDSDAPVQLRMTRYEHTFYKPDGGLFLKSEADFRTGQTTCTTYPSGQPRVSRAAFRFSTGSYAGAAMVLPLLYQLRRGDKAPLTMSDFVCAPGPRIVKVEATTGGLAPWKQFSAPVIRSDIKPDFGWFNYVLAPFMPEIHAWFDPAGGVQLVGAEFARYYRGPEIILRRKVAESRADAAQFSRARR